MFKSKRSTPHTSTRHKVMPGRPTALLVVGAICWASSSKMALRRRVSKYRCCRPRRILGMSSRLLGSNLMWAISTSPMLICWCWTTRIWETPNKGWLQGRLPQKGILD